MTLNFVASESHFIDHLLPIWEALPEENRGKFLCAPEVESYGLSSGVDVKVFQSTTDLLGKLRKSQFVLVASQRDYTNVKKVPGRIFYSEHGAGQTYGIRHVSYAGGPGRQRVSLFLVPGPHPAAKNRESYPRSKVVEVGSPRLDRWLGYKTDNKVPVVVVSFHWRCLFCPEAGTAWDEFKRSLHLLRDCPDFKLFGHAHPRMMIEAAREYEMLRIPVIESFEEVMARADCYVCDNSSTLFEFAFTDRPVVLMNSRYYRPNANFGLRFWECASVGVECNQPENIVLCVQEALKDSKETKARRREAIRRVYTITDGTSTEKAVKALLEEMMALNNPQNLSTTYKENKLPEDGIWMEADKGWQGPEGRIFKGDPICAGYRKLAGGFWQRVPYLHPEHRAQGLESGGFAHRVSPPAKLETQNAETAETEAPEAGTKEMPDASEDKRLIPSENKVTSPSDLKFTPPSARELRVKDRTPLADPKSSDKGPADDEVNDRPAAGWKCTQCGKKLSSKQALERHTERFH